VANKFTIYILENERRSYIMKKERLIKIISILFVLVVSCGSMQDGRIAGIVKDAVTDQGISCTKVITMTTGTPPTIEREYDCASNGVYSGSHPQGDYDMHVTADEYEPYGPSRFTIDSTHINIPLNKHVPMTPCVANAYIDGDTNTTRYDGIQNAYNNASNGSTIKLKDTTLIGDLDLSRSNTTVTLRGGYNCNHSRETGTTIIAGDMSVTDGTIKIENMVKLQ
jgi:hypothetical protein